MDSKFWRNIQGEFRALPYSPSFRADLVDGQWILYGGPENEIENAQFRHVFQSHAERAGVASGAPNLDSAFEWWLNLLRNESPHFVRVEGTSSFDGVETRHTGGGGWIRNLSLASAEYCIKCETRAFAIEETGKYKQPGGSIAGSTGGEPGRIELNKKKRGRPPIPDELKASAVKCRAAGGTLKDAAKLIYNTQYPSTQQVKSTSTILRQYCAKSESSHFPAQSMDGSSQKPNKAKG